VANLADSTEKVMGDFEKRGQNRRKRKMVWGTLEKALAHKRKPLAMEKKSGILSKEPQRTHKKRQRNQKEAPKIVPTSPESPQVHQGR